MAGMPDVELKPQVYKDPRPKEEFDRYHAIVREHEPEAKVYEPVRVGTVLWALLAYRARGFGSERVPNGPVILAPNHASFMDHFFAGAFIRRRVQFMGKSQVFEGSGRRRPTTSRSESVSATPCWRGGGGGARDARREPRGRGRGRGLGGRGRHPKPSQVSQTLHTDRRQPEVRWRGGQFSRRAGAA